MSTVETLTAIGIAVTGLGALGGLAAFVISNSPKLKNKLFNEFRVSFYYLYPVGDSQHKKVVTIVHQYELHCSINEEIKVTSMYLDLGNVKINGYKKYDINISPFTMTKHYKNQFDLSNPKILTALQTRKLRKVRLVVMTNKYGEVKSNKTILKNPDEIDEILL